MPAPSSLLSVGIPDMTKWARQHAMPLPFFLHSLPTGVKAFFPKGQNYGGFLVYAMPDKSWRTLSAGNGMNDATVTDYDRNGNRKGSRILPWRDGSDWSFWMPSGLQASVTHAAKHLDSKRPAGKDDGYWDFAKSEEEWQATYNPDGNSFPVMSTVALPLIVWLLTRYAAKRYGFGSVANEASMVAALVVFLYNSDDLKKYIGRSVDNALPFG